MQLLYDIVSVFFFVWVFRNTLFWMSTWEMCHFRLGAFLSFLFSKKGRRLFFSPVNILKILGMFAFFVVVFIDWFFPYYQAFVVFVYLLQGTLMLRSLRRHFRLHVSHIASFIVVVFVMFVIIVLYSIPLVDKYVWLIILDKFAPFLTALGAYIIAFPLEIFSDAQYEQALAKMRKRKDVTTIIFYGGREKNSIASYTKQILEHEKEVAVVYNATNDTDVARAVNRSIKSYTNCLLLTLTSPSYQTERIIDLVHPSAVVFANDASDLSDIKKFLQDVPQKTMLLIDNRNQALLKALNKVKRKKIMYGVQITESSPLSTALTILCQDVTLKKRSVSFAISMQGKRLTFSTNSALTQSIDELLPGIFLATCMRLKIATIKRAVIHLKEG